MVRPATRLLLEGSASIVKVQVVPRFDDLTRQKVSGTTFGVLFKGIVAETKQCTVNVNGGRVISALVPDRGAYSISEATETTGLRH